MKDPLEVVQGLNPQPAGDLSKRELLAMLREPEADRVRTFLHLVLLRIGVSDQDAQTAAAAFATDPPTELMDVVRGWLKVHSYQLDETSLAAIVGTIIGALSRLVEQSPWLEHAIEHEFPWVERILGRNQQMVSWSASGYMPELPFGPTLLLPDPSIGTPTPARHTGLKEILHADASVIWDDLAALLRGMPGMWPAVWIKAMGDDRGDVFKAHILNIQGLFEMREQRCDAVLTDPIVALDAVVSEAEAIQLFESWSNGGEYQFRNWRLQAPGVDHMTLDREAVPPWLSEHLLASLPASDAPLKAVYAYGSGEAVSDTEQRVHVAAREHRVSNTRDFTHRFVGLQWQGQGSYVSVAFPLGVTVAAQYEAASASADVSVGYRPPYEASHFLVRAGQRFAASDKPLRMQPDPTAAEGWFRATLETPFPGESGFIFVSTEARTDRLEWQCQRPLGRALSQREGREAMLRKWYELSRVSLGDDLRQASEIISGGRRNAAADRFELAVANLFSTCGFPVLFGGKVLSTEAIDFVAFDETANLAYAVSVTVASAGLDKFRDVKALLPSLEGITGPTWSWQIVVASAQSAAAFVTADLRAIVSDGGVVLTWEHFEQLAGDFPDFDRFRAALTPSRRMPPPMQL